MFKSGGGLPAGLEGVREEDGVILTSLALLLKEGILFFPPYKGGFPPIALVILLLACPPLEGREDPGVSRKNVDYY